MKIKLHKIYRMCLLLVACLLGFTHSWAGDYISDDGIKYSDSEDISYTAFDKGMVVVGYDTDKFKGGHLVIPSMFNGRPVTGITGFAFFNCDKLLSVEMPNSVTRIQPEAFRQCPNLQSVVLSNSITAIDQATFQDCSSLQSIEIPSKVTSIGVNAFHGCTSLKTVKLPNNLKVLESAFNDCSSLQSINIPVGLEKMGTYGAFYNCSKLQSIDLPSCVSQIEPWCFYGCTNLQTVNIAGDVTVVGMNSFNGCKNLQSLKLGALSGIDENSFKDCSSLQSPIVVQEGVTAIPAHAFDGCYSLLTVTLPNSLTSVGEYAFNDCSSMTHTEDLPSGLTSIGQYAFANCGIFPSEVNIPEGITSIEDHAFQYTSFYNGLRFPNGLISIGESSFQSCSLSCFEFPNSLKTIGNYAFAGNSIRGGLNCSSLFTFPEELERIGDDAFESSFRDFCSIYIPKNCEVGKDAFASSSIAYVNITDKMIDSHKSGADDNFWGLNSLSDAAKVLYTGTQRNIYEVGEDMRGMYRLYYPSDESYGSILPASSLFPAQYVGVQFDGTCGRDFGDDIYNYYDFESVGVEKINRAIYFRTENADTYTIRVYPHDNYHNYGMGFDIPVYVLNKLDKTIYVKKGKEVALDFGIEMPADVMYSELTFESNNNDCATVSAQGVIRGESVGSAEVKGTIKSAAWGEDIAAQCNVIVYEVSPVESSLLLKQGASSHLALNSSIDLGKDAIFSSSNENVATVDSEGNVTTKSQGTTLIKSVLKSTDEVLAQWEVTVYSSEHTSFNKNSVALTTGSTQQLTVSSDFSKYGASFRSSNTDVATVDENGNVAAVGVGTAFIQYVITSTNEVVTQCEITVYNRNNVAFGVQSFVLKQGASQQLKLKTDVDLSNYATYQSNNTNVAAVDQNGNVTAVGPGTAIIKYVLTDTNEKLAQCEVTIYNANDITFDQPTFALNLNETQVLALKSNVNMAQYATYQSSNTNVAIVLSNGNVSAVGVGTAVIKYVLTSTNEVLAQSEVTVYNKDKISFGSISFVLKQGKTERLVLNSDVDLSNYATYQSSNTNVATIDQNGNVTAVGVGTATLKYVLTKTNEVLAQCDVTTYSTVAFAHSSVTLKRGTSERVTTNANLNGFATYRSQNKSVATVDNNGNVKAIAAGSTNIEYVLNKTGEVLATCVVNVYDGVYFAQENVVLKIGETSRNEVILDNDLSNVATYQSSNTRVATVDADGNVKAVGVGSATISYVRTSSAEVLASSKVYVYNNVSMQKSTIAVKYGNTLQMVIISDANLSSVASYKSSNTNVVTVDENGLVRAVGTGSATVQYVLNDSKKVLAECRVYAYNNVSLSKASLSVKRGQSTTVTVNSNVLLTAVANFTSSNSNIATVTENGAISGVAPGEAIIKYVLTDGNVTLAQCKVTVYGTVSFAKKKMLVKVGKSDTNILTTDGNYNNIAEYTVANGDVVKVKTDGTITGVAVGKTTVKYVLKDYGNTLAQYSVVVYDRLTFDKENISFKKGETQHLTLKSPVDLSAYTQFVSSNESIATVDDKGNVTAQSDGVTNVLLKLKETGDTIAMCKVVVYTPNPDVVYVGGIYYHLNEKKEAYVTNVVNGQIMGDDIANMPQCYSATINIPKKVTYQGIVYDVIAVGENAFASQNELLSVYIPSSVKTICANGFTQAKKLKVIHVEDGSQMVNVGPWAFADCSALLTFKFDGTADKMRSIDDYAFYKCSVLNNVVLPESVTSVGNYSFRYCDKLTNIQLSKELNIINEYAFGECGFSQITLPEALASIQAAAFINNSHLTSITIPSRLEGIGPRAFENNSVLQQVNFNTTIYTMTINDDAFHQCPKLNAVNIVNLRSWAQTNFSNTDANPASTAHHLYMNNHEIFEVKLPTGTRYINNNAFNGCTAIRSLIIPETVEQVAENIFLGCASLKTVYCYADVPPMYIGEVDPNEMKSVFNTCMLYVPYGSENSYRHDDFNYWNRFATIKGCTKPSPDVFVSSITLNTTSATIYMGETLQLTATVLPVNATNSALTWMSSDASVATVSENGVVTPIGEGTTTISVMSSDGSDVTAMCEVTVVASTGINEITIGEPTPHVVYRLDGVRVYDQKLKPGIYIINGKKVMVK